MNRKRIAAVFGRAGILATACMLLTGCTGVGIPDPASREAERLANLTRWMFVGAAIVWVSLVVLALYALYRQETRNRRRAAWMIIGGGAVIPTILLAILLSYGLALLPDLLAPAPEGSLKISVSGEQWWWRVRYELVNAEPVELANEIRIPVGEPVEFRLESPDVIHSFWVPSMAGKMDMIPGRVTRLSFTPTKTGTYRGVCAEYCGASHALMSFFLVVMEKQEFARWLNHQRMPAQTPSGSLEARGQQLLLANGCHACHTIRGTEANGVIGPDLTHVGSRLTLAAGVMPNKPEEIQKWLTSTDHIKPDVYMPNFGMLPPNDLHAIAMYLNALK